MEKLEGYHFLQVNPNSWVNFGTGAINRVYYKMNGDMPHIWNVRTSDGSEYDIEPFRVESIFLALGINDDRKGCTQEEFTREWESRMRDIKYRFAMQLKVP